MTSPSFKCSFWFLLSSRVSTSQTIANPLSPSSAHVAFAISHRGLCLPNHIRGRGGCRSYAHLRVLTAARLSQHHQLREHQLREPSISSLCLFARADGLFISQPQRPIARPCMRARDAQLLQSKPSRKIFARAKIWTHS
jgi:hypothetical protein